MISIKMSSFISDPQILQGVVQDPEFGIKAENYLNFWKGGRWLYLVVMILLLLFIALSIMTVIEYFVISKRNKDNESNIINNATVNTMAALNIIIIIIVMVTFVFILIRFITFKKWRAKQLAEDMNKARREYEQMVRDRKEDAQREILRQIRANREAAKIAGIKLADGSVLDAKLVEKGEVDAEIKVLQDGKKKITEEVSILTDQITGVKKEIEIIQAQINTAPTADNVPILQNFKGQKQALQTRLEKTKASLEEQGTGLDTKITEKKEESSKLETDIKKIEAQQKLVDLEKTNPYLAKELKGVKEAEDTTKVDQIVADIALAKGISNKEAKELYDKAVRDKELKDLAATNPVAAKLQITLEKQKREAARRQKQIEDENILYKKFQEEGLSPDEITEAINSYRVEVAAKEKSKLDSILEDLEIEAAAVGSTKAYREKEKKAKRAIEEVETTNELRKQNEERIKDLERQLRDFSDSSSAKTLKALTSELENARKEYDSLSKTKPNLEAIKSRLETELASTLSETERVTKINDLAKIERKITEITEAKAVMDAKREELKNAAIDFTSNQDKLARDLFDSKTEDNKLRSEAARKIKEAKEAEKLAAEELRKGLPLKERIKARFRGVSEERRREIDEIDSLISNIETDIGSAEREFTESDILFEAAKTKADIQRDRRRSEALAKERREIVKREAEIEKRLANARSQAAQDRLAAEREVFTTQKEAIDKQIKALKKEVNAERDYQKELRTLESSKRKREFKTQESELLSEAAKYGNIFGKKMKEFLRGKDYSKLNEVEKLKVLKSANEAAQNEIAKGLRANLEPVLTGASPSPPPVPVVVPVVVPAPP